MPATANYSRFFPKGTSEMVIYETVKANVALIAIQNGVVKFDTTENRNSITHILRWPDRKTRNSNVANFKQNLINEGINYDEVKSDDSQPPISIPLPKITGKAKQIKLIFKFQGNGGSLYTHGSGDTYETQLQETLTLLYLTYLLKGGTDNFSMNMVDYGSDAFNDFKTKLGNNYISVPDITTKTFTDDMATFLEGKPTWVRSINMSAKILKQRINFNTNGSWVIARPDVLENAHNPYNVWHSLKKKLRWNVKDDKWNPGDIWFVSQEGKSKLSSYERLELKRGQKIDPEVAVSKLNDFNGFLVREFNEGNIIGMSLKKFGSGDGYTPTFKVENKHSYFDESVELDEIELSPSTQDVKFYLKVTKVERDPETERITKRIKTYSNQIWLQMKTRAGGFRLELNISGTGARHGSVGQQMQQNIISETDKSGIRSLIEVRKRDIYEPLKFDNREDRFMSYNLLKDTSKNQLGVLQAYVSELYKDVTGSEAPSDKLGRPDYLDNKLVASELAYVIKKIPPQNVNSVIENLYRIAASKGAVVGLNRESRDMMEGPVQVVEGVRQTVLQSSIFAKVY